MTSPAAPVTTPATLVSGPSEYQATRKTYLIRLLIFVLAASPSVTGML